MILVWLKLCQNSLVQKVTLVANCANESRFLFSYYRQNFRNATAISIPFPPCYAVGCQYYSRQSRPLSNRRSMLYRCVDLTIIPLFKAAFQMTSMNLIMLAQRII